MILLAITAAAGAQQAPLTWSDAYWAKQAEFQRCYDGQMVVIEKQKLSAKQTLDGVLAACKPQWDARVEALRVDLAKQRSEWSREAVDDFFERHFRDFYDLRLHRLQQAFGEVPVIVQY